MDGLVKYSIVMPVFQSANYITSSVERVARTMDLLNEPYEILLVDDHSTDGTWEVLKQLKGSITGLRIFRLGHNLGQTPATMAGAQQAKGALIITLDDDMQHPPEEIPKLIAAFESNDVDVVFGDPENRHHPNRRHPFLVALGRFMFHNVYMRKYRNLNFFTTFRIFRADLISTNGGPWSHLFFIWQLNPLRAMHTPTVQTARKQGQTNHTVVKLIRHFSPFLWYFSLRTVWVMQIVLLLVALVYFGSLYSTSGIDTVHGRFILILALALIALKMLIMAKLKRMEHIDLVITEG